MCTSARPRKFLVFDPRPPLIVFKDGAAEEIVTFGAFMYDPEDKACEQFGDEVPTKVLQAWRSEGSKQVIHQAELWPAVVSRSAWASSMQHRRVMLYVDNDATRAALIRGSSANVHSARLVWMFWDFCNPADTPSRLDFATNEKLFGCRTTIAPQLHVESSQMPWEVKLVHRDVL